MTFDLKIDKRVDSVEINPSNLLAVLEPNEVNVERTGVDAVAYAMAHPIGKPVLKEIVKTGEKIVIMTSDITRPMPTAKVMPVLLKELYEIGVKSEDITLVFAVGSHRSHTEAEKRQLAGDEVYEQIACVDADVSDCVHYGVTKRGTPVDIDRRVAEADRRICLGNIEYHYFAGYSGGAKAIMPGVSTRAAIQTNHAFMVRKEACVGRLEGNPLREDIEEAVDMVGVDFIINVVLDAKKEIIHAVAGDITKAHRAGCAFLDTIYCKEIPERAEIVITSQAGAPKDLNLYQTQKALDNAKHAVKDGGIIILVGSCKEGLGEATFEDWLLNAKDSHSLIEKIREEFKLGGHKAAAIAMVLENADIYLVSDLEDELVEKIFMKPFHTVQEAYDAALARLGAEAKTIVMPYGGSTLPRIG